MARQFPDTRPWTPDQPVPAGMVVQPDGATGPDGAVHGPHLAPEPPRQPERTRRFGENPPGYTPSAV